VRLGVVHDDAERSGRCEDCLEVDAGGVERLEPRHVGVAAQRPGELAVDVVGEQRDVTFSRAERGIQVVEERACGTTWSPPILTCELGQARNAASSKRDADDSSPVGSMW
jgi:hypothetical protein